MTRSLLPALSLLLAACGLDPAKVPGHELAADDGQLVEARGALSFAVVGNLRDAPRLDERLGKGRAVHPGAAEGVLEDLESRVGPDHLSFLVLMGDEVRRSSTREWRRFDRLAAELLDGSTPPAQPHPRIPVLPVVGEGEYRGDRMLRGYAAAFPGVGADIGYNRVGTWGAFDVRSRGTTWRFLVLDSDRSALGPRWKEQVAWIPQAVQGDYDELLVFMHHPLVTLAVGGVSNAEGAPRELLELVEDSVDVMKLRLVFSADPSTTEAYLLGGRYGTLHLVAGGGGAPAQDLQRWGPAGDSGLDAAKLEPIFDLALLNAFHKRWEEEGWPDRLLDEARGEGSYAGFPGVFDARAFPLYGYWEVTLDGPSLQAGFRLWEPGGSRLVYQADYMGPEEGWHIGS